MIDLLLVGAGRIAHDHAVAVAQHPDARIVGVVDPDRSVAGDFAAAHRVPGWFGDLDEGLARSGATAAIVCAPTAVHAPIARAAMAQGLHVLLEKPFAPDLASAQGLVAAAKRSGVALCAAQVARFLPMFSWAHDYIRRGDLGRPIQFVERRLTYRRENPAWWHDLPEFLVPHWGSHSIDLLCYLLEVRPSSAFCRGTSESADYEVIDDFNLHLDFEGGLRAGFHMSFTSRASVHDMILIGEDSTLTFDCYCAVRSDRGAGLELPDDQMLRAAFAAQLAAFLRACNGDMAPSIDAVTVLDGLHGLDLARASLRSGTVVGP